MPPATKKNSASNATFSKYKNLLIDPNEIAADFGYWSTGSPKLDKLLGGGLTRGRISELFGREQSGKSTVALSVSREVIKTGGKVLYIDLENGLELRPKGEASWLEINGIDAFNGTFDIIKQGKTPIPAEEVYNVMIGVAREKSHQYVIVDSMAAFVTQAELAGELGDANMGSVARVNAQGLKTLFALQGLNSTTSFSILNQVRDTIGPGIGGFKSTGGRALPHYTHQRLRFDKLEASKIQKDGEFLTPIRVRALKLRGAPAHEVSITISSRCGIDVLSEVFEGGVTSGYIKQAGAWYSLFDDNDDLVIKTQGETALRNFIAENREWFDKLYEIATTNAKVEDNTDEDEE